MEKELDYLVNAIESPEHPFVAILGGAKVSDKIAVIESLLTKCDKLLIGGGMANTFFKAQGIAMGDSLVEDEALDTAKTLLAQSGGKLVLPDRCRDRGCVRQCRKRQSDQDRRRRAGWLAHPGHRPGDGRSIPQGDQGRQDHRLERPDGRL